MASYRPSYRRAFTIPIALAVVFILAGLVLGQTLGSHARLVNKQQECRADQLTVTVVSTAPATQSHPSFELLAFVPHKGTSCTLAGYPTVATQNKGDLTVTKLGPRFGMTAVTITTTIKTPDEVLISPAVTPYALRLPNTHGLIVLNQHAPSPLPHYSTTPIFTSSDAKAVRALAQSDITPHAS